MNLLLLSPDSLQASLLNSAATRGGPFFVESVLDPGQWA